jgi:hypothetical protein
LPCERNVSYFLVRIATADVRVSSGEPDLSQVCGGLVHMGSFPHSWTEWMTMLVQSQGLESMFDITREICIIEFVLFRRMRKAEFGEEGDIRYSKRADSVPYCASLNLNFSSIWIINSCQATLKRG